MEKLFYLNIYIIIQIELFSFIFSFDFSLAEIGLTSNLLKVLNLLISLF
jgi:hypothetical protein